MNIYFKVGFLVLIVVFGFIMILPFVKEAQIGTDIIVFGAGDADSILIRNQGKTILIDTGLKADREVLGDKLKTLGVRSIDYMILTHPDKDHIGGASYILDNFNVENLIQSKLEKGTKAETRIEKSLDKRSVNNIVLKDDYAFSLGDLELVIYAPLEDTYKKSNDYSLITHIKDRNLNYIFAGDAEEHLLGEVLEKDLPVIDFYKLPHHGRWNSNSEAVINKLMPGIVVISNNKADDRIVRTLEDMGSQIYYAYSEDLTFFSDGKTIEKR